MPYKPVVINNIFQPLAWSAPPLSPPDAPESLRRSPDLRKQFKGPVVHKM